MTTIFQNKGIKGKALEEVVEVITTNKTLWVDTILHEEYGLPSEFRSPIKAALYTFFAFIFFGLVPLLPYVFSLSAAFFWSCLCTGLVFFMIGSIKSYWSVHSWIYSGIETLLIGSFTAALAYTIGFLLHLYLVK